MKVLNLRLGEEPPKANLQQLIRGAIARVLGLASPRPAVRLGLELLSPDGRQCWTLDFADGVVTAGAHHPVDALIRGEQGSMLDFLLGNISLQTLRDSDLVALEGDTQVLRQMAAVFS